MKNRLKLIAISVGTFWGIFFLRLMVPVMFFFILCFGVGFLGCIDALFFIPCGIRWIITGNHCKKLSTIFYDYFDLDKISTWFEDRLNKNNWMRML
jgi:hypothetical protein